MKNSEVAQHDLGGAGAKFGFTNRKTTVVNGSNQAVMCALSAAGSTGTDRALAIAGLAIGGIGVAATVPVSAPSALGVLLATIGWYVSVGGAIQTFSGTQDKPLRVLFPGDTMLRDLPNFAGKSDLHITQVRSPSGKLVISTTTVPGLGDEKVDIKTYLSESTFDDLLTITLPPGQGIVYYRTIIIPSFSVRQSPMDNMPDGDISNGVMAVETNSEGKKRWYGTLEKLGQSALKGDGYLFEYSNSSSFTFTQGITPYPGANVLIVDGTKYYVLKLTNCFVNHYHERDDIYQVPSDDAVVAEVKEWMDSATGLPAYGVYGWNKTQSNIIYAYKVNAKNGLRIDYSASVENCVYFVTDAVIPSLTLLPN